MINIFIKIKEFLKTHKKKIITIIAASIMTIIIVAGGVGGLKYSHAKANIKYSQDQLEKIALEKMPGEVVKVEKELNFREASFEYKFKIKDKDNMLQVVKLDSQYGAIVGANRENHMKENKDTHNKYNGKHME